MSDNTSIAWTDATWNPIVGCSRVSEGCRNCYAERMAGRLAAMGKRQYQDVVGGGLAYGPNSGWSGKTALVESALSDPLHWRKGRRIFVCSMGDLFHEKVPFDWIDRVFAVMALSPQHTFQVLTKRPERMAKYCAAEGVAGRIAEAAKMLCKASPPPEVFAIYGMGPAKADGQPEFGYRWFINRWPIPGLWLGTSCENQAAADARIPHLLRCPAAIRFLSCEPLLGDVNIDKTNWFYGDCRDDSGQVDWVIVGGESGPKARPCDIAWIRSIRDQCTAAGVACFVKQLGAIPYMDNRPWLRMTMFCGEKSGKPYVVALRDHKGGDPAEWPADLRNVRQWPKEEQ